MNKKIIVDEYTLPAIWACYLINGDPSGLSDEDIAQCDRDTKDLGRCVSCSEESWFGSYKGIGHDLATFQFHV